MVFESLISPITAKKHPWEMIFFGIIYASVAVLLSMFVFADYASLTIIFLTVLAAVPLMHQAIRQEEKRDLENVSKRFLLKEHARTLSFFMFLFVGFVIAFAGWYLVLPPEVAVTTFETQEKEITAVQDLQLSNGITGHAVSLMSVFGAIFFNNIMVLMFALLFAFFYGVGAIFILTWNASVLGVAIGQFITNTFGGNVLVGAPASLLRYSIHGLPEMLAYFMAGLAGSIISVAIIRHDFGSGKFQAVVSDSLDLVFMAVFVLFVAAGLEVFITPLFFSG